MSITLATCNGARHLAAQLRSLQAQRFTDFELLVGDDASDDGTRALLQACAAQDPRVRLLLHPRRLGLQRNFETLMRAARGRWIAPCDQDDVWAPDKLARLVSALQRQRAVMAYCDSELVDAQGLPLGRRMSQLRQPVQGSRPLSFVLHNCVSGHAMLFDRRVLAAALPFPDAPMYDWWLAMVAATQGQIVWEDAALVQYRQHGGNLTDPTGARRRAAGAARPAAGPRWQRRQRDVAERLQALASLCPAPAPADTPVGPGDSGVHGPLAELQRLWPQRERRRFVPELAWFCWRHRADLWAIKPQSAWRNLGRAVRLAFRMR